ncbi:type II secretion system F family protein [Marinomonas sp. 15G1-11]|uniref:Type II secretion system F family protein n=1 Tax=Marinomonas phaeophyticola TaxID=3004091 RepID=A0ABT4JQ17_9GAMM|nr:type II secretion system F family protein [Marinomonas sp. 15G1-11]MCZ2720471.1 type II secretion system F family protein [Marinomonas sp. 15G1-11]
MRSSGGHFVFGHQWEDHIFLEQFFSSLRLYNFFELLLASIDSGESLQNSIKKIAMSSSHHLNKKQLYILYYKIRLGFDYSDSFPQNWFLKESRLALVNSNKNGSIDRALSMASELQKQRWTKTLNTLNNIIPVASLLIAGLFVAQLLISIYAPLMEPF